VAVGLIQMHTIFLAA